MVAIRIEYRKEQTKKHIDLQTINERKLKQRVWGKGVYEDENRW
jgi:hypothetical protein